MKGGQDCANYCDSNSINTIEQSHLTFFTVHAYIYQYKYIVN